MELVLQREPTVRETTFGILYVNGVFECHTLEDAVRPVKVPGKTAIPAGRYQVIVTPSPRFKRDLPLLVNVPNFEGVRIHPGNKIADTEGCILPGKDRVFSSVEAEGQDAVVSSRIAFDALFKKITTALKNNDDVSLLIRSW